MKYCKTCQSIYPDSSVFCSRCGQTLIPLSPSEAQPFSKKLQEDMSRLENKLQDIDQKLGQDLSSEGIQRLQAEAKATQKELDQKLNEIFQDESLKNAVHHVRAFDKKLGDSLRSGHFFKDLFK